MDPIKDVRKELRHDQAFWEPMRELRESVDGMPWYPMHVNNNGIVCKILGKAKTLVYDDGWRVMYAIYDQGQTVKKVIQITVKGYVWSDIPKDLRHGRANVILDTFFNPDNAIGECAVLPTGGIQFAQDELKWQAFIDTRRALN